MRRCHFFIQPIRRIPASLALVNHLLQDAHAALKLLRQLIHVFTADNARAGGATATRRAAEVYTGRLGIDRDALALDALDAEHHRRRSAFAVLALVALAVAAAAGAGAAVLLEGQLRRRDGKVGRQAGRPGDGPFAVWIRRRREVDDEGAVRRVGLRGGEHGGGVVVAEEVVDARVDGGVSGGVCQEGEDGLEGGDVVGRWRGSVMLVDDVAVAVADVEMRVVVMLLLKLLLLILSL